ncbi:MAG: hypothetical protein IK015_08440 [Treponema sp.]|nr:hypothetical protein [Treponema sp.]
MKLSKRFSLLKKSLGLTLIASCILAYTSCNNFSTLPATSSTIAGIKTLDAPVELKASNGGKRKISLSWNVVSVAKYYKIYCSDSPNGTFTQVGESFSATYEDAVASGRTYYYKVSSVNGNDEESEMSEIVTGTSLATPIIDKIEQEDTCASIQWYCENSASYEDIARFEVHCTDGNQDFSMVLNGNEYSYTFYNLSANTSYKFYVELYTIKDPDDVEKSAVVTKVTYSQYTPVAPEFTASQGNNKDGVALNITLPSKVQVSFGSDDQVLDIVDSPLYFVVYRKRASEGAFPTTPHIAKLYFDGTTTKPSDYSKYEAGTVATYIDSKVDRGIKYEYLIKSYIDAECPELVAKNYNKNIGSRTGNTTAGWTPAEPTFEVVNFYREISGSAVTSVSVQFKASWNAMGKATSYCYAIMEQFTKKGDDPSVTPPTLSWYQEKVFDSVESINGLSKIWDLTQNAAAQLGSYNYILCIIPEDACADINFSDPTSAAEYQNKSLIYKSATSSVPVSDNPTEVSTTISAVKGGWKNKTQLKWPFVNNVQYSLKRGKDTEDKSTWTIIPWATIDAAKSLEDTTQDDGKTTTTCVFEDTSVEGGHTYHYELYADGSHPNGIAVDVNTLGEPAADFNAYAYDTVTVAWSDKNVCCADHYKITLGTANSIGGGASADLAVITDNNGTKTGVEIFNSTFDGGTTATIEGDLITLCVAKPANYNDATISGAPSNISITAYSDVDDATGNKTVTTLGPAGITTSASVAQSDDTITVTWNKVDGATAYLVRRDRMDSANKTSVQSDSYVVPAAGGEIKTTYVSAVTTTDGTTEKLVLTDKSMPNDSTDDNWKMNAERLAWGYPYRYTIFPLRSESDSVDTNDAKTTVGAVTYNKETAKSATGSTNGYGLDVLATKSQDPHRVKITWTPPYSTENREAKLWRSEDAATWTKVEATAAGNSFTVTPKGDDRCKAFYYAVSYAADTINVAPHAVYTAEISAAKDTVYSKTEAKNKGYPFALYAKASNVADDSGKATFKEKFEYTLWNPSERAVGPATDATYTVSVKNNNYGAGYNTVATINKLKQISVPILPTAYNLDSVEKVNSGSISQSITLKPKTVDTNDKAYDTGLLSVLRDYKHYYKIGVTRTLGENENAFEHNGSIEASWGDDTSTNPDPVYAWRNVTNAELARAAMLAMTYGFFRAAGGKTDYSNTGDVYVKQAGEDIAGGKFSNKGGSLSVGISGKYYHHFEINKSGELGYAPAMLAPGGVNASAVSISTTSTNITFWRQGANEGFLCFEDKPVLNVSAANSEVGNIYDATITVKCGGEKKTLLGVGTITSGEEDLKIDVARTYSGTSYSYKASSSSARREYFPIQFGTDRNWDFKNSSLGWWGPKTN